MDLEFTEEQEDLRGSVRAFLESECPRSAVRRVVETGEPVDGLWAAMVGLDWPALSVPPSMGGMGLGMVEVAVVAEELGAAIAPGPFLSTVSQFVPVVREVASPDQQARYLEPVAAGRSTGALALADHPARWSLDEVTARARPVADGWQLEGRKHAVLAGPDVDQVAVVARVADGGLGVFVLSGGALKIESIQALDRSRPLSEIDLDGAVVPPDQALGTPGLSGSGVARAVEEATTALALELVGTCGGLFRMVLGYAKDRHQFGVPIGSFQAVKHKMVDMFVVLERARALGYHAVAAIEGDDPGRAVAVAMAKAAADDCQRKVCKEALQVFGGIGFTWEHDAHLFVKRAKTDGALFGTSEEHTKTVARHLGLAG